MKKDQANGTQLMIKRLHLHIICGSQSMSDMAHMWRTVIRVFMLLLSYFGGLAWLRGVQGRQRLFVLSRTIRLRCPIRSSPGKRIENIETRNPPFTETSTLKITVPRSKLFLKTRQQYVLLIHHPGAHINDTYMCVL